MENPPRLSLRGSESLAENPDRNRKSGRMPVQKKQGLFWTRSRKEALAAWLFILPDAIGLLIFVAIPMVLALSLGFFSVDGLRPPTVAYFSSWAIAAALFPWAV